MSRQNAEFKSHVNQVDDENEDLREQIKAVELKNKMLNDKINEIIYNKATSYKERTLMALGRDNSPRGRRERANQFGISEDHRVSQLLAEEKKNDQAFDSIMRATNRGSQSPHRPLMMKSATNFSVV